jgi:hypothetical protein
MVDQLCGARKSPNLEYVSPRPPSYTTTNFYVTATYVCGGSASQDEKVTVFLASARVDLEHPTTGEGGVGYAQPFAARSVPFSEVVLAYPGRQTSTY